MTAPNPTPSSTCPHCHQPMTPGVKFCETCGAKVEEAPACPLCGAPLTPGVKFCESCGKPVTLPAPAPVTVAVPAEPGPPVHEAKAEEIPGSEPDPEPEPEKEPSPVPVSPPAKPGPEPAKTPARSGKTGVMEKGEKNPVTEQAAQQPASPPAPGTSQKTLIIAGIVGLLVIAAVAIFVVLPMLSGTGAGGAGNGQDIATTATPAQTSPPPVSGVSFEPLPTQIRPVNLEVIYQVVRSPVTGIVTVTFSGGPGLNGIASTLITVTRSDGQVMTKSWKPAHIGDSVTVQGTTMTDRVEVVANFYNGDSYRCFDQVFEYKKRN